MRKIKIFIAMIFIAKLNYTQAQGLLTNLQACYPLDCDNAVNMAATGAALNGNPVGVSCTTGHTGVANTAYAFANSVSSYIELPSDVRIRPDTISFSAWVKLNNVGTPQFIAFTKNSCVSYFEGYAFVTQNTSAGYTLRLVKSGSACSPSTEQVLDGITPLNANQWYHVGFYMGNDFLKIYLDGNLESSAASTVAFDYGAGLKVCLGGSNVSYFNYPLDGDMDNVRFYNRELSQPEFYTLYNQDPACNDGVVTLTTDLEACYPLDCNAKNLAPTAAVPPSLDGTPYNVKCDVGHTGVPNTGMRFAGTVSSYIDLPNDPRLKPNGVTNGITFTGWSNITTLNPLQYIVFTNNGCGSNFEGYALVATDVSGSVRYDLVKASNSSCGSVAMLSSSSVYGLGWHHLAFYMDNTVMKLYVDGGTPDIMSSAVPLSYSASDDVYLGGTNATFNYPFDGIMDNVRFYSRELSAAEISYIYYKDPACDQSRIQKTVGLAEGTAVKNSTELYPNPGEGKLYIRNGQGKSFVIYDVAGQAVQHTLTTIDETTSEINLSNKAEGIYFVRIFDKTGNVVQTTKIVIAH